jgi:hypothetical protein
MARPLRILGATAVALSALSILAFAQTMGEPQRFTASAVNMNNGGTGTLEIVVNRWSTDAERSNLVQVLVSKGEGKLLEALQKTTKVGYIRSVNSIGWDLHYAHRESLPDGGEQVVIATDRPMGFREVAHQWRTTDYPFEVVEMHLNADGEGSGTLSVAAKVTVNKKTNAIELENFGTSPVLLQAVKREKATH